MLRRIAPPDSGFILSLLLNMVFRFEWAAAALILLILHFVLGWPLFPVWLCLAAWILHSLLVTILLIAVTRHGNEETPPLPNKNPYSKKTGDFPAKGNRSDF